MRDSSLFPAILALAAMSIAGAEPALGQRVPKESDRCRVDLVGDRWNVVGDSSNKIAYVSGNVHARCQGRNIHMYADSMIQFPKITYLFAYPGKQIRYEDSTTTLVANQGAYYRDGERFEARGSVQHHDKGSGSMFVGQALDYYRPIKGVRNEVEIVGSQRPTLTYATQDSLGKPGVPIMVIGNNVRLLGRNKLFAGGLVVLDRAELHGESDSLWLDTDRNGGQLIGKASLVRRKVADSFALTGKTIDLGMAKRELNSVKARDQSKLDGKDFQLLGDSILIALADQRPERATAWGKKTRPQATSGEYLILGDSLVIETPNQRLDRVKAFGKGWAGFGQPDSGSPKPPPAKPPRAKEKGKPADNWIRGDLVEAAFTTVKAGERDKMSLRGLKAIGKASCLYNSPPEKGRDRGGVTYTRADTIFVVMRVTPDSNVVDSVSAYGNVDGIQGNPRRSASADTSSDTTAVKKERVPNTVRARNQWQ